MFQRTLLFVRRLDGHLDGYESFLTIDESQALVVTAKPLISGAGYTYLMSLDGTKRNLQLIADWKAVRTNGPDVGPYIYLIKKGVKVAD